MSLLPATCRAFLDLFREMSFTLLDHKATLELLQWSAVDDGSVEALETTVRAISTIGAKFQTFHGVLQDLSEALRALSTSSGQTWR